MKPQGAIGTEKWSKWMEANEKWWGDWRAHRTRPVDPPTLESFLDDDELALYEAYELEQAKKQAETRREEAQLKIRRVSERARKAFCDDKDYELASWLIGYERRLREELADV